MIQSSHRLVLALALSLLAWHVHAADPAKIREFRAGAFAIDVTPLELPVIVNGGMTERVIDKVEDRLHARCLVLDDGTNKIAIVIVDSCMMPRELLDDAKRLAQQATKIPPENMLIAATHCHSAPSVFACLGSEVDEKYAKFLPVQIAKGIQEAHARLQPARIGWAVGRDDKNVASRRWLMQPGSAPTNPFSGKSNDRAMMHPGPSNKNAIAATGIIDADVPVLSVQTKDGQPLAVLTNYSMHYVGAPNISADYFAVVCEKLAAQIKPGELKNPFVAMHSNGTSGDQWLMDYTKPRRMFDRFTVGAEVAAAAFEAYQRIVYHDWVPLVMAEKLLEVGVRMPSAEEVAKAKSFCETFKDRKPKDVPEVYARETVILSELPPTRELKLQALRIGELGIAAIPNEVFSSTGLMIKIESPTPTTFTIELANGCFGYIPPPKQHKLGGYETWRARSSCLEENAEPKIRAAVLELLNKVSASRADEQASGRREPPDFSAPSVSVAPPKNGRLTPPARQVNSPVSPEESLQHFQLRQGLKIELVASEPQIVDPVAFDWGYDGRLWVVEMHDYPNGLGAHGPNDKGPPGGRIKVLEDADGDGRYEKSTLFADGLSFPNGILVLPDGVLVTSAPHIMLLKDTNGDSQADEREVLFSGFAEGNQQLRVNGLRWGLDGWIYCANGGVGRGDPSARIKVERTGKLVDVGARDFRFALDYKQLEPQLGMSQFGRNRDDFGNWFGCNNNTPLFHIVHDDALLARNPHLVPAATTVFVPQAAKPGPVFAISEKGRFYHASEVGRFTSANSAMIYRDSFLGDEFSGNFFVSEPVHNLVHREVVTRSGVSFTSRRAADEEKTEFLASRDTWFRPNTIRTGPDGALYLSDMYREIVEHPAWIAPENKAGLTFRAGDDRGRLYRIVPEGKSPRKVPRINRLKPDEIAKLIEEPSGELRDMAQRWLVCKQLKETAPGLGVAIGIAQYPGARVQALWTVAALGELTYGQAELGRGDSDPSVRATAIRATLLGLRAHPDWANMIAGDLRTKAASEPNPAVQLQIAYALGELPLADNGEALIALLARTDDAFVIEAALSSVTADTIEKQFSPALIKAYAQEEPQRIGQRLLPKVVLLAARMRKWNVIHNALAWQLQQTKEPLSLAMLGSTFEALAQQKVTSVMLRKEVDETMQSQLDDWFAQARKAVGDPAASESLRAAAVTLLGRDIDQLGDMEQLKQLLSPQSPPRLQAAAVEQLVRLGDKTLPAVLIRDWKSHLPALRAQVLDALLSRADWTTELLAAIERRDIAPADLDAVRRQRLLEHPTGRIKTTAAKLLTSGAVTSRQDVLTAWAKVAEMPGDAVRGKEIFTKRCASCHKWQGEGQNLGPDLNTLTDRSPKSLLTALLDPNQAVEPKYQAYIITTDDGRVLVGTILEESATALKLADAGGRAYSVSRTQITELKATGKSLMPEGMERELTEQSVADLLKLLAKP